MSTGGSSFGSAGLHVGTDWNVRCNTYPDSTPILSIGAGSAAVSVSISTGKRIGDEALAFARELARQAARFAADCERLYGAQQDQAQGQAPGEGPQAAVSGAG